MSIPHPRKVGDTNVTDDMLQMTGGQGLLDKMAVADLVVRERLARDNGFWEEMASYYHEDSSINVSWFKGSGAEFVAGTVREANKRIARTTAINFHVMTPPVVTIHGDRALAETPSALRNFMQINGVEVTRESFVTLLWRARRTSAGWLIAGLRCIYIRDLLLGCNPSHPPVLDEARLSRYRRSYRFMAYTLEELGVPTRDDLPGEDRPETVTALRAGERHWLETGQEEAPTLT